MCGSFLKKFLISLTSLVVYSAHGKTFQGTFSELVIDNFRELKASSVYQLKVGNDLYTLKMSPKLVKERHLKTGDEISVEGEIRKENNQEFIIVQSLNPKIKKIR